MVDPDVQESITTATGRKGIAEAIVMKQRDGRDGHYQVGMAGPPFPISRHGSQDWAVINEAAQFKSRNGDSVATDISATWLRLGHAGCRGIACLHAAVRGRVEWMPAERRWRADWRHFGSPAGGEVMDYETRTLSILVAPKDQPTFSGTRRKSNRDKAGNSQVSQDQTD